MCRDRLQRQRAAVQNESQAARVAVNFIWLQAAGRHQLAAAEHDSARSKQHPSDIGLLVKRHQLLAGVQQRPAGAAGGRGSSAPAACLATLIQVCTAPACLHSVALSHLVNSSRSAGLGVILAAASASASRAAPTSRRHRSQSVCSVASSPLRAASKRRSRASRRELSSPQEGGGCAGSAMLLWASRQVQGDSHWRRKDLVGCWVAGLGPPLPPPLSRRSGCGAPTVLPALSTFTCSSLPQCCQEPYTCLGL